jgi:hypothetical protein
MNRSKYRAAKILTGEPLQEIAIKPLAVILYELDSGEALKVILHKEPFGECICLSDFRSGRELTRCHPTMPPLVTLIGPLKGTENRSLWIEVGKAFLEAHFKTYAQGQWAETLESLKALQALNGGLLKICTNA